MAVLCIYCYNSFSASMFFKLCVWLLSSPSSSSSSLPFVKFCSFLSFFFFLSHFSFHSSRCCWFFLLLLCFQTDANSLWKRVHYRIVWLQVREGNESQIDKKLWLAHDFACTSRCFAFSRFSSSLAIRKRPKHLQVLYVQGVWLVVVDICPAHIWCFRYKCNMCLYTFIYLV